VVFAVIIALFLWQKIKPGFNVGAEGVTYYVSTTGLDTNPGTLDLPLKTFAAGVNKLQAGDTLYVLSGTYTERLSISKNGTSTGVITVKPAPDQTVVIDGGNSIDNVVYVTGSYIRAEGFEVKNSTGYCVNIGGTNNVAAKMTIHDCQGMGLYTDGKYITLEENTVYMASLVNQARTMSSGWGSGIKVRVGGENISIINNTAYHNYGEGIAVTRGINTVVRGNKVYDNYSVNIYIDNSHDVVVEKNFSYCNPLYTGFEKSGRAADAYAIGEESYSGWGAQLANVTFKNNIGVKCYKGITYYGADVSGGGMKNIRILNNTFYGGAGSSISLEYDAGTSGTVVANNIFQQDISKAWVANRTGINMFNNFWMPSTPSGANINGTGDKSGNVQFATTPSLSVDSYKLASTSPAINSGSTTITDVTDDYSGNLRYTTDSPGIDMGSYEFYSGAVSIASPTPTATSSTVSTPTPLASITPTTTPTPTATPTSNFTPVITTNSLPSGRRGILYTKKVTGYDKNKTDTLTMTTDSLPAGLLLTDCVNYFNNSGNRRMIDCYIKGTPTSIATTQAVKITISDQKGASSTRSYNLVIY
jgi:parallel beta-helix repeat protein